MTERHTTLLGELAELGMKVARDLQARVAAAESDEAAQGIALAFQRVARAVRQTLALEARLARDAAAEVRAQAQEGLAERREAARRRAGARQTHIRSVVAQEIFRDYEDEEVDAWLTVLEAALDEAALDEAFLDQPVEAAIAAIRASLGLPANDAGAPRAAPRPADGGHGGDPDRLSSA